MKNLKTVSEIFIQTQFGKMPVRVLNGFPEENDEINGKKITRVRNMDNQFPNDEMMTLFSIDFENGNEDFYCHYWEI